MTPIEQFRQLSPKARDLVQNYARRRGIPSDGLTNYLRPPLNLDSSALPQIDKFIGRLTHAVRAKERILVYGDYDADGISATSILIHCLRDVTGAMPMWSLPNRQNDHYGLDLAKAKSLHQNHQPKLLVCLDCGANSTEAITWLKDQGVDTLVIDHHPFEEKNPAATAVINPKTNGIDKDDLCAAGLTLFTCHELAKHWNGMGNWNWNAAVMLAGIATLADAVRLSLVNRALVKNAMTFMQDANVVAKAPGLAALLADFNGSPNQRDLQFGLIPALNAPGRISSPDPVVVLLTTHDSIQAESLVRYCREQNEQRKRNQRLVERRASEMAREVTATHPGALVLVLANRNWHHGVAGPAASHIAGQFKRSTILLASDGDHWRGSGRAVNGDHLGRWLALAKSFGLVQRGGGHAGAVGLALTCDQLSLLQTMGLCFNVPQTDSEPETEIIGEMDQLIPHEWARIIELLAPYGRNNPYPLIAVNRALCMVTARSLTGKNENQPWAMKAQFKTPQNKYFTAIWRDIATAQTQWIAGCRCDLTLELTTQRSEGKIFYNWSVRSCRPVVENGGRRLASADGFQPSRPAGPTG